MFLFKPTTKTYSDPVSATFAPGVPLGREYSRGDICLLHEGFVASKVFLNSKILREAILNSTEYLEEVLDIKFIDKKVIEKPKKEAVKSAEFYEPKPKKKKTKEPVILDAEPLEEKHTEAEQDTEEKPEPEVKPEEEIVEEK